MGAMSPKPTTYGWQINDFDDGGPLPLGESEGFPFPTVEEALEDARGNFDEYSGAKAIYIFKEPGGSYDDLIATKGRKETIV